MDKLSKVGYPWSETGCGQMSDSPPWAHFQTCSSGEQQREGLKVAMGSCPGIAWRKCFAFHRKVVHEAECLLGIWP